MADETYTGVMVALLPAETDPIVAASSEPAHMTLVFLGQVGGSPEESEPLDPGDVDQIVADIAAYAEKLDGPLVLSILSRGTLGDEGADVAFVEPSFSAVALRDGMLEASPRAAEYAERNDRFLSEWNPHVTLGYPDTPADGEYAGETVSFDRIAVWVGDEHHDFDMGGAVSDQTDTGLTASLFVLEFDSRSDDGDRIVGPFDSSEAAESYVADTAKAFMGSTGKQWDSTHEVYELAEVIADAEAAPDEEMPPDELEEGEELVTEIPVHGVATLEGKATGDGRGFRPGALSFGRLPAPLGYEFESGHGSDNSRVAVVGRIDEFWTVPSATEGEGVFEVRWRGAIMPGKPYGAQAIESIVDGSYDGLSVIVDSVEVDVEEEREAFRQRIMLDMAEPTAEGDDVKQDAGTPEMTPEDIESIIDAFVGDGKQSTTWFNAARIRRFDMVPTGAFQEGYTSLGPDFEDEMTPAQIEASAAALADCGCGETATITASGATHIVDLTELSDDELETYHDMTPEEQAEYAQEHDLVLNFAPGTKDGPGWITHPVATSRIRRYWVRGAGAAKIKWGLPGDFNRCRSQLAKYVQNPEWLAGLCANMHKEALGIWPGQHHATKSITASAAPRPLFSITASADPVDGALFANPNFTQAEGIQVDGERVFGYIAVWNVCHIADPEGPGRCTLAPHSQSNYAWYRTGTVMTTDGPVPVGQITMATGHAGQFLTARQAAAHYDDTGFVFADVACGEDSFGIWFSGRIRPGVTDEDIYAVLASGRISGDWRQVGGHGYELVGGLVVNVPGFAMPNPALVASANGGVTAIIGEGIFEPETEVANATTEPSVLFDQGAITIAEGFSPTDVAGIAIAAVEEFIHRTERAKIAEELAPMRARIDALNLANARRRLALITQES